MEGIFPGCPTRPKLLVIDDEPINIRVLNELLRPDCDVFLSTSGEQALAMCHELQPDLILLDVVMEGMDGYEVCRRLKDSSVTRQIPVMFVTGNSEEELGFELGAVDYIKKPFNPVVVRARVRTHLKLKLQSDYLHTLAMQDHLTGIPNRRLFNERLNAAWGQACRSGNPLSLLMIDVDYFKKYNDHYGHLKGDQCLGEVAKGLLSAINRPYDLLARFGGEEFAALLPDTDEAGAIKIARRMHSSITELGIEHCASDVSEKVSVSIGVATCLPVPEASVDQHLDFADRQLYRAKTEGRNRVCSGFL